VKRSIEDTSKKSCISSKLKQKNTENVESKTSKNKIEGKIIELISK
jgi:hypothetical protein